MKEKIKIFLEKIRLFKQTGYWNPKFAFLATIANSEEDDEDKKMLWTGASMYLNKGDIVYDKLYLAINDLETYKRLFERMEKKNGK